MEIFSAILLASPMQENYVYWDYLSFRRHLVFSYNPSGSGLAKPAERYLNTSLLATDPPTQPNTQPNFSFYCSQQELEGLG